MPLIPEKQSLRENEKTGESKRNYVLVVDQKIPLLVNHDNKGGGGCRTNPKRKKRKESGRVRTKSPQKKRSTQQHWIGENGGLH